MFNMKFVVLLVFIIVSCGVKTPPTPYVDLKKDSQSEVNKIKNK